MTRKLTKTEIASVLHAVNKAYCESLGDYTQPDWEKAPEWQRRSSLETVELFRTFPNAGPEATHEDWMAKKHADGWRWGDTKDEQAKTHPCLVPFYQLSREQKSKDYIMRAVVLSLSQLPGE